MVVPTRDRADLLQVCLTSIERELSAGDELIVVDSASRSPATRLVARRHRARLIRAARPGASRARNVGWRSARHPVIVFVDDDVRVTPGWLDALVRPLETDEVAFVTGRVEVPPRQRGVERPVAVKTDRQPARLDEASLGILGASCNLGVRRGPLEAVGGFDERLGPGTWFAAAEDVDLFDRLFAAGYHGHYTPGALVYHEQWRGRRQLVALDWGYGKGMGARLARVAARDSRRARRLASEVLWEGGVRTILSDLRHRYEFGALTVTVRTVGTIVGFAVAVVKGRL